MLRSAGEWWPDVLEEHLEELEFLWNQRRTALGSPEWTTRTLAKLDGRIEAHADALELAGEDALQILEAALASTSAAGALAAALPLMRIGTPAALQRAAKGFYAASGAPLQGFRDAFCHAASDAGTAMLVEFTQGRYEIPAVVAFLALAFQRRQETFDNLVHLLQSRTPDVKRMAWETAAMLGPRTPQQLGIEMLRTDLPTLFRNGMADPDPSVREAVRFAAAWTRQGWLLPSLRHAVDQKNAEPSAVRLLAVLATPEDVPRVRAAAAASGPAQMALLGALAHPSILVDILEAMESDDRALASQAGIAFRKITGVDVSAGGRVPLRDPEEGEDELAAEFREEVILPDSAQARDHWAQMRPLHQATRCLGGLDLSKNAPPDAALLDLDRQSFQEMRLRQCFLGKWAEGPAELEKMHVR